MGNVEEWQWIIASMLLRYSGVAPLPCEESLHALVGTEQMVKWMTLSSELYTCASCGCTGESSPHPLGVKVLHFHFVVSLLPHVSSYSLFHSVPRGTSCAHRGESGISESQASTLRLVAQ